MSTTWESVALSLNGQDCPMGGVSLDRRPMADDDVITRTASSTYEISVSSMVPASSLDLTAFCRRRDGASDETLLRRVRYGGRKGRSALRRLFKRSAPVQMAYGPVLVWGRCVWLEPEEMLFRASVCRRHR